MRRALGPFLTTGVALVAATVVVANPVAPPSRDMQISTTQLSTSPDLLSPSDKSLLSALTPQLPVAGLGPALAQILAALAADADRISREVTSEVDPPAPVAAPLPEQTAYHPESLLGPVLESPNAAQSAVATSFSPTSVANDVVDALNGLVLDTSYLGGKVVEAAFTLVDVIIRVPQFVVNAALDLLNGDVAGAINTVKSAIKAFFGPGLILLDGIRDVLYGRQLPPLAMRLPGAARVVSAPRSETTSDKSATETATDTVGTPRSGRTGKAESSRKHETAPASAAALRPTTTTPKSASSDQTTTTATSAPKTHSTSKPSSGSARAGAGSARDSKVGAAADSSSD